MHINVYLQDHTILRSDSTDFDPTPSTILGRISILITLMVAIGSGLWAAWFLRNCKVLPISNEDLERTFNGFHMSMINYNMYAKKVIMKSGPRTNNFQSQNCPAIGWVKVNFDASTSSNIFRGMGIVIREENGEFW